MKYAFPILLIILVISACGTEKELKDGYTYLKPINLIKPKYSEDLTFDYKIYEENDSIATIYFDILNENLLSKRDSLDRWTRKASLQILVRKNGVVKDVFENVSKEWLNIDEENFTDSLTIKIPKKEDVYISTIYNDLNKHVYFENQQWWIRKNPLYPEQFILIDPKTSKPSTKHFQKDENLWIESNHFADKKFEIKQYKNFSKPAIAPFSLADAEPDFNKHDSIFNVSFENNLLKIGAENCLSIISNPLQKSESIAFFTNNKSEIDIAIQCMTYICSAPEIGKLKDPEMQKIVFDQFWLKAAGNNLSKSKLLQNEFSKRIVYANKNFSSFKLGALTDLGMIYIVYGEPIKIEKDGFQQNWYYSQQGNEQIKFTFLNDISNGIPNNYYLERSPIYRSSYYLAVENWRNGMLDY
jgi:GWxTD domain-containing protein